MLDDKREFKLSETELLIKKLHIIELAMLGEFIRICQKYSLRYYLIGGSALGAVRHSGFIPWDDDIDIGMPRVDYEKFLSVAQAELDADLFLQTHKTDPAYPFSFAKIRNSKTTFIQSDSSHLQMNHGVYIDIFPLDGYPSSKLSRRLTKIIINLCNAAIFRGQKMTSVFNVLKIKHIINAFIVFVFSNTVSLYQLHKLLDNLVGSYEF
jgi:lipopolysaccharide cholinephosphotransferase